MKLKIIHKLFILASLPIITLLIFSLNHIDNKVTDLDNSKLNISKLEIMRVASFLIHESQIERGLSASLLHNVDNTYFPTEYKQHKVKMDQAILNFHTLIENINKLQLSTSSKKYITTIEEHLKGLKAIRDSMLTNTIHAKKNFIYYTTLNKHLTSLFNSFKLSSISKKSNSNVNALHALIRMQESAGKERAFVSTLTAAEDVTAQDMQFYHNLLKSQDNEYTNISFLLENQEAKNILNTIDTKYSHTVFNKARKEILNHEREEIVLDKIFRKLGFGGLLHHIMRYSLTKDEKFFTNYLRDKEIFDTLMLEYINLSDKKDLEHDFSLELQKAFDHITIENLQIDDVRVLNLYSSLLNHHITLVPRKWFQISTQRINDIHEAEKILFDALFSSIKINVENDSNSLLQQILLTIFTIFMLLAGTYYISRSIKNALTNLEIGLNEFFEFLNFKRTRPENIKTNSDDEISQMSNSINTQLLKLEDNLEEDQDFIHEVTGIVTLMKDGDFSERLYFEPLNPNLKELKQVFNQLIELIAQKIKEQTDSLETLNSSLEDRVHFQTLELEKQIEDITVAMDKAIAAEQAKDEFLANMSHEIRTPLNAILGFVTILQKQIKDEKPLKYLNIISTSGKSLLTIINDILDFSKIQSGKFNIAPHEANIVNEMSNATLLFASKAYEKHLIYDVYIDPTMPKNVLFDTVRVKQIFSNLLSNAIKFTAHDRSIKVKVIIENSRLIVSVQDTGIGISEENISKVFNAFEQADGTTTRKYGGTGLGLSISHKLAELMQGTLSVTSKEGVGSTFKLDIPIEILNEEPIEYIDAKELSTYKIALLDIYEDSVKLKLIKKYLLDFGATDIILLDSFQKDGYHLLFFTPDDMYNEEIVENNIPAIAILRNSAVRLANLKHIHALYTPFTPQLIVQSILEAGVTRITDNEISLQTQNDTDIKFKGSVLVAEDNKTNQMLISLILDGFGLKYDIANDGLIAVDMFKEKTYDLVLMDENMPNLNGIGAMEQINSYQKENELELTPIIALTASVLETDKEKFINAGMDGFVGKPIDNNELASELARFLEKVEG